MEVSRYDLLVNAWNSHGQKPFDQWILDVSDAFHRSKLGIGFAAGLLGVRVAEFQAALALATLEDEDLALLASSEPPKTTWFALADANREEIEAAIIALSQSDDPSPFKKVSSAMKSVSGPSIVEKVGALGQKVFVHAAKKAETYGLLRTQDIRALKGFASSVRTGRGLTPRQISYARDLLEQLVEGGAVVANSQDGDKAICDEILKALGRQ
jgi:hypothetical protein